MNLLKKLPFFILCMAAFQCTAAAFRQPSLNTDTTKLSTTGNNLSASEHLAFAADTDGTGGQHLFLQSMRFGDKRILRLTVQTSTPAALTIGRGANTFFTLSDSTVIRLTNLNSETSKFENGNNVSLLTGSYELTDDDEISLCSGKVVGIQMQYDGGVSRFVLREDDSIVLSNQCLALK